mmetsp:Transcript_10672/g.18116  ORF Transcript_10672/g.18116 Transcript_10672/m.18116 type:complete len:258 (-) Transcript_10672:974-1747(-)
MSRGSTSWNRKMPRRRPAARKPFRFARRERRPERQMLPQSWRLWKRKLRRKKWRMWPSLSLRSRNRSKKLKMRRRCSRWSSPSNVESDKRDRQPSNGRKLNRQDERRRDERRRPVWRQNASNEKLLRRHVLNKRGLNKSRSVWRSSARPRERRRSCVRNARPRSVRPRSARPRHARPRHARHVRRVRQLRRRMRPKSKPKKKEATWILKRLAQTATVDERMKQGTLNQKLDRAGNRTRMRSRRPESNQRRSSHSDKP